MLNDLFLKYNSDKTEHGYSHFYEKNLPRKPTRLLEIGVKNGGSIRSWLDFYPNTQIFGLDLFEEMSMPDDLLLNTRVTLIKGNQCDWRILEELRKYDFDVIIDDGSHNARDQMMTFFGLFNGKHYFIEDLHCNCDEFYSQGLPEELRAYGTFPYIGNYLSEYGNEEIKVHQDKNGKIICIQCT
jgi:hypothetical protein